MRREPAGIAALAVAAAALFGAVPSASADLDSQLLPVNMRVADGEDVWHPDPDFLLVWDLPPIAAESIQVSAAVYRVRDGTGAEVTPEASLLGAATLIEHLLVPAVPGAYRAEVRLEGSGGERGPWVGATVRFDDARPGPTQPLAAASWFAADVAPVVELRHPAGPLPVSGIRGYAVSVDRGGESGPCQGLERCSLEETDLRDGIEDDRLSLGVLPEGPHTVRAVAVSGSGMRSIEAGSAVVRVDATKPSVTLRGAPPGWADGPVRLVAEATDPLSGVAAAGPGGPFTAIAVDGDVPRTEPGDRVATTVAGEGAHSVAFYARDAAGNADEESPPAALVRIDQSAPTIVFMRSQDPAEPERIEASLTDALSGPDPSHGSIAVRPAGTQRRFAALATSASGGRLVARWDSEAYGPGHYEFRATGYDRAGNVAASDRRAGGARMVLANPLKKTTAIGAGLAARRRIGTVPYGRAVSYAGRLTSPAGSPLSDLAVRVVESFDAGAGSPQRLTLVRTAADGSFSTLLPPGPSRQVEAVFAGNRTLTHASGGRVRLGVLGRVSLRASSSLARIGGAPVIFSGRLGDRGAPIPSGGRPVELQFRLPNREWSEFRTVQTDSRGRFRYAYSFSDDDSRNVRFQFRAFAAAADDWPYEPAGSRPIAIVGR